QRQRDWLHAGRLGRRGRAYTDPDTHLVPRQDGGENQAKWPVPVATQANDTAEELARRLADVGASSRELPGRPQRLRAHPRVVRLLGAELPQAVVVQVQQRL